MSGCLDVSDGFCNQNSTMFLIDNAVRFYGLFIQYLEAKGMKCGHHRQVPGSHHQQRQSLAHLQGGFVGEGYGQNVPGVNFFFGYQVGDAQSQGSGFPGSGPRNNSQGSTRVFNRPALIGVQFKGLHTRFGLDGISLGR